jgi:Fur family peroxide stress response transcriptional regulator
VKSPVELTETFRANGLKVTPQRQLLFSLMHGNTVHPTAEVLFAEASVRMPGISLRTVYQTLTDLASMGELRLIDVGTGATRFDPNTDDHHHVVCSSCGEVRDVYVAGSERLKIDGLEGFEVDEASILFSGTCASCVDSKVSRASARG